MQINHTGRTHGACPSSKTVLFYVFMASEAPRVKAAPAVCSPVPASHALPPTAGKPFGRRGSPRRRPRLAGIDPLFTTALALAIASCAAVSLATRAEAPMPGLSRLRAHLSCALIPRVQPSDGRYRICQDIGRATHRYLWGCKPGQRGMGQVEFIFVAPRRIF